MAQSAPAPHPWTFEPAIKVPAFSHRTVASRETLQRVRACAKHVPITRVSDLTPLDRLRLPVFSATTPLARDLTTHMGKGLDVESAHVSAMMEAVERVSAEQTDRTILRAPFHSICKQVSRVAEPSTFDLPHDSKYTEDLPISWIEAWDLLANEAVWVPADVALSPPQDGVLRRVDTNGLAAGNSALEAVVHALCEVIERDALGLLLFKSMFAEPEDAAADRQRIDLASLPPEGHAWVDRISGCGLRIETELLESDIDVPVFRTLLIDDDYPSGDEGVSRTFVGLGASPNAAIAAVRSITEAVQSRLAVIQGARDSFNTTSAPWRRWTASLQLRELEPRRRISLEKVSTFSSSDLREDLSYLLDRLRVAGVSRVFAIDLTRPHIGVPVVRIRVPELTSFAVDRRRIGWRCLKYLL